YGAFDYIYKHMDKFPYDNFDLEMSKREYIEKFDSKKDITWGVIDVHSHIVESVDEIFENMKFATKYVKINKLWFDPDCGLKTRKVEEAKDKLKNLVQAVKKIRREYENKV
ncbi:MAG: methionine synthase, partial [bacterium]|nr:methionine synthase [bacterium]